MPSRPPSPPQENPPSPEPLPNPHDILEKAPIGIFTSTPDGRFLSANPAMARLYGYDSPHELVTAATDISAQIYGDPAVRAAFLHRLATEDSVLGFESLHKRKDGTTFWTSESVHVVRDTSGGSRYIQGFVADISARKQTEQSMRENEECFRRMFLHAPAPYQSLDEAGNFLDVNQAFLDTLGYSRQEVIGKNFREFLHPDWIGHFTANFPRFKTLGEMADVEIEMRKKDGSTILVVLHGKIQRDDQGRFQRTLCVFQDISERRRVENALHSAAECATILSASPPLDQRLAQVVAVLQRITGISRAYIFRNEEDPVAGLCMTQTHEACAGGIEPQLGNPLLCRLPYAEASPSLRAVLALRQAYARTLDDFEGPEREVLESQGIQSLLILPVFAGEVFWGFLGLDDCLKPRRWRRDEISMLEMVANAIGMAASREGYEAAVLEREKYLATILQTTADGFFVLDVSGRILEANAAFAAMSGHGIADLAGMHITDIDVVETPGITKKRIERIIRNGSEFFETRHQRKDRSIYDAELSVTFMDEDGGRLVCFCRDITARKAAAEELRRSTSMLEMIRAVQSTFIVSGDLRKTFNGLLEALVALTDSEFGFLDEVLPDAAGQSCTRRLALSTLASESTHGKPPPHLPEDAPASGNPHTLAGLPAATGKAVIVNDVPSGPRPVGLPPGHPSIRTFMGLPLRFGNRLVGVAGVANRAGGYDRKIARFLAPFLSACAGVIHAVRLQEAEREAVMALQESELRFRKLLDDVDMVAVQGYDEGRRVVFWNRASQRVYGYTESEARGRLLEDLIIPEGMREDVIRAVADWVERGVPIAPGALDLRHKDGGMVPVYSSHVMQKTLSGRKEMYCIDVEMTEIREAQRQLVKAKEAAEEASEAKSRFLANMSHEIRTPLNGIMGMMQLLESTSLDSEQEEYIASAMQSCRRLTELVGDILDLSRIEAGRLEIKNEAFDLRAAARSVEELFRLPARQKKLGLRVRIDPAIPDGLMGDSPRLQQILNNLVGNAIKFSPSGEIVIEACPLPSPPGIIRVLFSVTDSGIGMAADMIERLFAPFTQADERYTRKYQGAGLGLSICKQLVELMGGSIAVETTLGAGSTFYFSIPFRLAPGLSGPVPGPRPSIGAHRNTCRILLAEDDKVNRMAIARTLEKEGHAVYGVENGQQAVQALANKDFDMILMDVQMPVMDGVTATRHIRRGDAGRDKAGIPIIALTAYAMDGDRERFLAAGMDDYVAKPMDRKTLNLVIGKALSGLGGDS